MSNKSKVLKWGIPVGILMVLVAAYFLFFSTRAVPFDPTRVFEQYYEPFPLPAALLPSEGVAASTIAQQAYRLYQEGRYEQAGILFEELKAVGTPDHQTALLHANALMAQNRLSEALPLLKSIPETDSLYTAASWYLGLAYLGQGALRPAMQAFETEKAGPLKTQEKAIIITLIKDAL